MHHAVGIRPHDLVIVQWRLHETTKPPGPWIVWWGICKFGLVRDSKDEDDRTAWIQFQGVGAPVKEVAFPQDGDNGTVLVDYLKVIVLPPEDPKDSPPVVVNPPQGLKVREPREIRDPGLCKSGGWSPSPDSGWSPDPDGLTDGWAAVLCFFLNPHRICNSTRF